MKKRLILLLQVLILIMLLGTSVFASENTTLNIKVPKLELERGKEYEVTLALKDVNNEVKSIEGYILLWLE